MVGIHKGLNAFIKTKNPECKFLHCMLYGEALVAKKLKPKGSETHTLEKTFSDVVKIINEIRTRPRVSREFSDFCQESLADHDTLILHSEVWFLLRGKVLKRFISLKKIVREFLIQRKSESAAHFEDLEWLGGVHYLSSIFIELNKLNTSLQGKGGDIFAFIGKINTMKEKVTRWVEKVNSGNFSMFPDLEQFLKTCQWETEHPDLEKKLKRLVTSHLNLLSENCSLNFPKKFIRRLSKT